MYDIAIIGAGPAGLTAAIYAGRASKKVLVLEAVTYGGQIINSLDIANYPAAAHISGLDFAKQLYAQAQELGAEIVFEQVTKIEGGEAHKTLITEDSKYLAKAVIIATGATNRKLGLAHEDELVGKGISYCATCDGAFYRGKTVAVQGGGNTAVEDALYLADLAEKVYLIHRRDEFRADATEVAKLQAKANVEFVLNSNVTKLNASDRLESLEVTNQAGEKSVLPVAALFVAIGRIPETAFCQNMVELDERGYVVAGEDCHTSVAGIFVAGDGRTKALRQLVTATADGAIAVTEAIKYLNDKEWYEQTRFY